jgi:hypothetical protein
MACLHFPDDAGLACEFFVRRRTVGATSWIYFTDYSKDIPETLQALREEVFQARWLGVEPFETLEELEQSGLLDEEGAHSIIDVDHVIEGRDVDEETGAVRLLPQDECVEYFGSATPTRDAVERAYKDPSTWLPPIDRGAACCTVVYDDDGIPAGLAFWGRSGF